MASLPSIAAFGELLWDILPSGAVLGGAPFNFAYRMNSLGIKSTLFSRVGDDDLGEKTLTRVQHKGMDISCIGKSKNYPTGTVDVNLDEHKSPDFKILSDVAYDYIPITPEMEHITQEADCFYFGTVAQRSRVSRKTLMTLLDYFSGNHIFFDINLRTNCYSQDIIKTSLNHCTILKVNEHEVPRVADCLNITHRTLDGFLDQIILKSHIKTCVITLGEKGACAISHKGEKVSVPGFSVVPVDTCGSGDGFSAGFLYALFQKQTLKEACRFGNALGALVALQSGATEYISLEDITRFMDQK